MKQTYTIPYKPDSMNTHWRIAKNGGQYLSKAGREFRDNVQQFIKLQKYKTFKDKIKVKIELCFKSKRERDIDNYFKAILDSFNGFLYEDDKLIYELSSSKKLGCDRDYFIIEVEELNEF
jgi:hypothetical protein|nr:MAG TPA: Endodeoxyribonuclease RusA [Caudoviricetes sp.]